jgi:hypothetical protein
MKYKDILSAGIIIVRFILLKLHYSLAFPQVSTAFVLDTLFSLRAGMVERSQGRRKQINQVLRYNNESKKFYFS